MPRELPVLPENEAQQAIVNHPGDLRLFALSTSNKWTEVRSTDPARWAYIIKPVNMRPSGEARIQCHCRIPGNTKALLLCYRLQVVDRLDIDVLGYPTEQEYVLDTAYPAAQVHARNRWRVPSSISKT